MMPVSAVTTSAIRACSCGGRLEVVNSRVRDSVRIAGEEWTGPTIYRRLKCSACGNRFTTYEFRADMLETLIQELKWEQEMRRK